MNTENTITWEEIHKLHSLGPIHDRLTIRQKAAFVAASNIDTSTFHVLLAGINDDKIVPIVEKYNRLSKIAEYIDSKMPENIEHAVACDKYLMQGHKGETEDDIFAKEADIRRKMHKKLEELKPEEAAKKLEEIEKRHELNKIALGAIDDLEKLI